MTSHSPNGLASHNAPGYSEEDKVSFKTPSDTSRSGSGFAKHASINGKDAEGDAHGAQWNGSANGARNQGELDPTWELTGQVMNMKLSDGGKADGDTAGKASTNGVLAPAAEIQEGGQQPHSRQSSGASSFDSPAIPTPGGKLQSAAEKNLKSPYPTSPTSGYVGYGYDAQDSFNGITNVLQSNGLTNGITMHYPQAGIHPSLSPLVNGGGQSAHMGPMPPFSPPLPAHMGHTPMSPQSQQMYQGGDFGADNFGMQQRMNARGSAGRGQLNANGNAGSSFAGFNGQPANGNGSGFAYGSPPHQVFNPGLMSPTMTSAAFQGLPYSPVHAPTPYSPYGAPQPLAGTGQMFDMMSNGAMSPQSSIAMLPGRNQNQLRGHGYSASQPPNLRDATATAQSPTRGVPPRAQPPRGPAPSALNHAHSLSLPHTPFSPQLGPVGYGPMSPPPYPNFYPGMVPSQGLTPEILQAMAAGMVTGQSPPRGQGFNPAIQNALGTLQQDPSVMALIQQGGGPSANNRKLGLYKTELCRSWEEKGTCKYGEKCQFAHGDLEQRRVERHPKYKTEICRTFWVSGSCPYGKRCCFIHTELPANAAAAGANGQAGEGQRSGTTPNQTERPQVDGRARSMSTNSDPNNEPPSSLLARISARAQANNPSNPHPVRPNRSGDGSPVNQGVTDKVIAEAVARALTTYGLPASSQPPRIEPPAEPVTAPSQTTSAFSGFSTRNTSTPASGVGGHHRVSASVDFGRQGRGLGSDLSLGLGSGMGHQRNPSASSVVPPFGSLSRTPLSGQSSPFGGEGTPSRGVTAGSALLESHPW